MRWPRRGTVTRGKEETTTTVHVGELPNGFVIPGRNFDLFEPMFAEFGVHGSLVVHNADGTLQAVVIGPGKNQTPTERAQFVAQCAMHEVALGIDPEMCIPVPHTISEQ